MWIPLYCRTREEAGGQRGGGVRGEYAQTPAVEAGLMWALPPTYAEERTHTATGRRRELVDPGQLPTMHRTV